MLPLLSRMSLLELDAQLSLGLSVLQHQVRWMVAATVGAAATSAAVNAGRSRKSRRVQSHNPQTGPVAVWWPSQRVGSAVTQIELHGKHVPLQQLHQKRQTVSGTLQAYAQQTSPRPHRYPSALPHCTIRRDVHERHQPLRRSTAAFDTGVREAMSSPQEHKPQENLHIQRTYSNT